MYGDASTRQVVPVGTMRQLQAQQHSTKNIPSNVEEDDAEERSHPGRIQVPLWDQLSRASERCLPDFIEYEGDEYYV